MVTMRIREFHAQLWFPLSPEELFPFFSNAANLEPLTPPGMRLRIVSPQPVEMKEGAMIDYQVRVHGLPLPWRARITVWDPPHRFVDEQLRGPYRFWLHEHSFTPHAGGTLARDHVRYAVPFDFLVHRWLVLPDIERIFAYRAQILQERFGAQLQPPPL